MHCKLFIWHLLVTFLGVSGFPQKNFRFNQFRVQNVDSGSNESDGGDLGVFVPSASQNDNHHEDSSENDDDTVDLNVNTFLKDTTKSSVQVPYKRRRYYKKSPRYDFEYSVQNDYAGNHFGHKETRDGHKTEGSYFVNLPDGRKQIVNYYVRGNSGFVAKVIYEGKARYPVPRPQSYLGLNRVGDNSGEQNEYQLKGYRYPPKAYLPKDYVRSRPLQPLPQQTSKGSGEGSFRTNFFQIVNSNSSSSEEDHEFEDDEEGKDEENDEEEELDQERGESEQNVSFNQGNEDFQIPRFIKR